MIFSQKIFAFVDYINKVYTQINFFILIQIFLATLQTTKSQEQ